jgi:hypothetical protein
MTHTPRRLLAPLALVVVLALSGCDGGGVPGGAAPEEDQPRRESTQKCDWGPCDEPPSLEDFGVYPPPMPAPDELYSTRAK